MAMTARTSGGGLPQEIVVWEVLVRLPPQSLLRYRTVCRSWRSLTSTRNFLLAHNRHQPSLPLISGTQHGFSSATTGTPPPPGRSCSTTPPCMSQPHATASSSSPSQTCCSSSATWPRASSVASHSLKASGSWGSTRTALPRSAGCFCTGGRSTKTR